MSDPKPVTNGTILQLKGIVQWNRSRANEQAAQEKNSIYELQLRAEADAIAAVLDEREKLRDVVKKAHAVADGVWETLGSHLPHNVIPVEFIHNLQDALAESEPEAKAPDNEKGN